MTQSLVINALKIQVDLSNFKVKEGTENRGAIESVVRLVRKTVGSYLINRSLLMNRLDSCCPCDHHYFYLRIQKVEHIMVGR